MAGTHKIFISHASADKELADEVVDFLALGLSIKATDFFCTSLEGLGIPSGDNFIEFIQEKLHESIVMISLLSPNYYQSIFCVCELGASWILSKAHIPIVVPPLKYKDIKDILSADQLRLIDKDSDWEEIRDELTKWLKLDNVKSARWAIKKDVFLKKLPSIFDNLPKPNTVSSKSYNELNEKYEDAIEEIAEIEEIQKRQLAQIKDLEKCKDKEEVKTVKLKYSSLQEEFDRRVKECKALLKKLPRVVIAAFFYYFRGEEYPVPEPIDRDRYEAVKNALEHEFLKGDLGDNFYSGHIEIATDDPIVEKAMEALEQLHDLIEKATDYDADGYERKYQAFVEEFREKKNYNLSFTSRSFWDDYLGL